MDRVMMDWMPKQLFLFTSLKKERKKNNVLGAAADLGGGRCRGLLSDSYILTAAKKRDFFLQLKKRLDLSYKKKDSFG